jgi:hypothetical protein
MLCGCSWNLNTRPGGVKEGAAGMASAKALNVLDIHLGHLDGIATSCLTKVGCRRTRYADGDER